MKGTYLLVALIAISLAAGIWIRWRSGEVNDGLEYHGYFEVFDFYMSSVFGEQLERDHPGLDWANNSVHIENAAGQSNIIAVPHVVENPRAFFYDPGYARACVENDLEMILYIHTLGKYIYFYDPRPCDGADRLELLKREYRVYEEKFREYNNSISMVQIYDEPWVTPLNVTHQMLFDMAEAAREIFWGKPIMVMFHRQGNTYRYSHTNGTIITYDDWAGRMPEAFDVIGVDPYYYSYHDESWPDFRFTGDQEMVESDVSWASNFDRPVILVGQGYDPGASQFFDRDNTDTRLGVEEGFEDWEPGPPEGSWSVDPGVQATGSRQFEGEKSLELPPGGEFSATLEFEEVHSVTFSFNIAVEQGTQQSLWFMLGNDEGYPVRLGIEGRDPVIFNGATVEVINRSLDITPGIWHSIMVSANVDANRWTVWVDGEVQTRMPNAFQPTSFDRVRITSSSSSGNAWLDSLSVSRYWSHIPPNEKETMLYYDVARKYPQVTTLMWWSYPHSFASSLIGEDSEEFQVTNIWEIQGEIWDLIG